MPFITRYPPEERLELFRAFFEDTMLTALERLEVQRRRWVYLLVASLGLFALVGYLTYASHVPSLLLFLWIPIVVYGSFIAYRMQRFRAVFKPRVVNLVLDFMEDGEERQPLPVQYAQMAAAQSQLHYDFERYVPIESFVESGIFLDPPTSYSGEDFIYGKLGNVAFEMCELNVAKLSYVRPGVDVIFRGMFLKAAFHKRVEGQILIFPRRERQHLMRTIKDVTRREGKQQPLKDWEAFNTDFLIYGTTALMAEKLLSRQFFEVIHRYYTASQKPIYISIQGTTIYLAIAHEEDILEPRFLTSNARFELVQDYFEDILLMITVMEDLDSFL